MIKHLIVSYFKFKMVSKSGSIALTQNSICRISNFLHVNKLKYQYFNVELASLKY